MTEPAALMPPSPAGTVDIYAHLVRDADDIVGLLAYGMHERTRRALSDATAPAAREARMIAFLEAEILPARIEDARAAAMHRLTAFSPGIPTSPPARPTAAPTPPPGAVRKAIFQLALLALAIVTVALMIRALNPVQ